MSIKKVIVFISVICSIVLLNGCYGGGSKYNIYIEDVKVFNQDNIALDTIDLTNYEGDLFLNNLYNGRRPINSAAPDVYYTGVVIEDELSITIKFICSVTSGFDISEVKLAAFRTDNQIEPKSVIKEGSKTVITFEISEIPSVNTIFDFSQSMIINEQGVLKQATVKTLDGPSRSYYNGVILKIDEVYVPYREEIKVLGENISTEFKLYQNTNKVIEDILNNEGNYGYGNYYSFIYNKNKYNIDFSVNYSSTYLYQECVYYSTCNGVNDYYKINYINYIYISDRVESVFGLQVNNDLNHVLTVMKELGFIQSGKYLNSSYHNYSFTSPLGTYSIAFLFNPSNSKVKGICLFSNEVFNRYE